jgi:hypothetical protein
VVEGVDDVEVIKALSLPLLDHLDDLDILDHLGSSRTRDPPVSRVEALVLAVHLPIDARMKLVRAAATIANELGEVVSRVGEDDRTVRELLLGEFCRLLSRGMRGEDELSAAGVDPHDLEAHRRISPLASSDGPTNSEEHPAVSGCPEFLDGRARVALLPASGKPPKPLRSIGRRA